MVNPMISGGKTTLDIEELKCNITDLYMSKQDVVFKHYPDYSFNTMEAFIEAFYNDMINEYGSRGSNLYTVNVRHNNTWVGMVQIYGDGKSHGSVFLMGYGTVYLYYSIYSGNKWRHGSAAT